MANSEAKKRANRKWNATNMDAKYDRVNVLMPKGQKAVIADAAQRAGESISQYMLRATQARMDAEQDA